MGETIVPHDREAIKVRMRTLVQSGNASGMRPPLHPEIVSMSRRIDARAQVLYLIASQASQASQASRAVDSTSNRPELSISYVGALRCAAEGSLAQSSTKRER